MTIGFLPIVLRELRVASRSRGTHLSRVLAALIATGIAGFMMLTLVDSSFRPAQFGIYLFQTLATVAFGYSLLVGARNTADCLSQEKRDGTLGLLFLTDLKGYDVVLGKLTATSLSSLYGLLAILPVLAIPLLMGGVSGEQIWCMAVLLVNTLFFSLAAGMFISSLSVGERAAVARTILLVCVVAALPGFGWLFAEKVLKSTEVPIGFYLPSPAYAYSLIFAGIFSRTVDPNFWWSLLTTHALGWTLLFVAAWRLPHAWQDKPTHQASQWSARWRRLLQGNTGERARIRTKLLDVNPVLWLTTRDFSTQFYLWALIAACGLIWVWGVAKYPKDWLEEATCVITALGLHTLLKLLVASQACRQFAEDRRSGALELLISTPMTIPEILDGQLGGLRRQFSKAVGLVLVVDVLFILTKPDDLEWLLLGAVGMIMLVADLYAIAWLGMWLGLTSQQPTRASGGVIWRIMILPWIVFWFAAILLTASSRFIGNLIDQNIIMILWLFIGLLIDILFFKYARSRLLTEFRTMALQHERPSPLAIWMQAALSQFSHFFSKKKTDAPPILPR